MKPHTLSGFDTAGPVAYITCSCRHSPAAGNFLAGELLFRRCSAAKQRKQRTVRSVVCRRSHPENEELFAGDNNNGSKGHTRRQALLASSLALGAWFLQSATASGNDATPPPPPPPQQQQQKVIESVASNEEKEKEKEIETEKEEVITSRIYDATVIGEPMAIGKDKRKVWEKVMNARIVYLGEAEQVPIRDDKDLELEIVKNLRKRCAEIDRPMSLALEAFPSDLQDQLTQFMENRIDGETLKSHASHWPPQRWQEYEPLLSYCRDNGVRLVACGTPLKVLRTVQAEGITGLSKADRKLYTPPAGSGFVSGFTAISRRSSVDMSYPNQFVPFSPSSYLSAQARVLEEFTMSQNILQSLNDGGAAGLTVVVTGASHVTYGSRGTGVPARISKKIPKKNQVVILLDPERQQIRREGEVPVADFLWYSAARACDRNCFDRAEIARVMNAAGRRRDALPQDLQKGLDLGLVSPEVLQNFFDLEQYPLLSELTHRFQGFRERLLADPKFLNRLAIEEAISITTTLLAQYERRKENFFQEFDYVITDTVRGVVVDFFTVWLPAPTLSFLSSANDINGPNSMNAISDLLGSIPDNAFQKSPVGKNWNFNHRLASVLFGGVKLASVGFVSSIGAVASSNMLYAARRFLNPAVVVNQKTRRSPILKTALVYSCFLGISANLRYQFIAGIVEHRLSEQLASQTFLLNLISFIARTINSYWGTQQWVDLARYTGLQMRKSESPSYQKTDSPSQAALEALECNSSEDANRDEVKN